MEHTHSEHFVRASDITLARARYFHFRVVFEFDPLRHPSYGATDDEDNRKHRFGDAQRR